jgi:hypothetical protein
MGRMAAVVALVAALAGCGSSVAEKMPAACIQGPGAVMTALAGAPRDVSMNGVRISQCFNRDAGGTDEQILGTNLLSAAQQLGDRAASDPEGDAALQLGYLIGAAQRGARRNGLAAELIRRLQQEQGSLAARSAAFRRGQRAGLAKG